MKLTKIFKEFLSDSKSGTLLMLFATVLSILLANSAFSETYINGLQFHTLAFLEGLPHNFTHWVNDGGMAIFFLLVGLEIERELYIGELNNVKKAMLPILAAIGGMIVPAILYGLFTFHNPVELKGIAIPTATDIAFAMAVLSLFGNAIPHSLKIFLTALAIMDDLGATVLIALFYGRELSWIWLIFATVMFLLIYWSVPKYNFPMWMITILGILLWYLVLRSGIHASIAGVLMAFALPFKSQNGRNFSERLEHILSKIVNFLILPVFALCNTAIVLDASLFQSKIPTYFYGILLGLWLGKPIGIFLFAKLAQKLKLAEFPRHATNVMLFGLAAFGGIGFTMSIFITNLAFPLTSFQNMAKTATLAASILAILSGALILIIHTQSAKKINPEAD